MRRAKIIVGIIGACLILPTVAVAANGKLQLELRGPERRAALGSGEITLHSNHRIASQHTTRLLTIPGAGELVVKEQKLRATPAGPLREQLQVLGVVIGHVAPKGEPTAAPEVRLRQVHKKVHPLLRAYFLGKYGPLEVTFPNSAAKRERRSK